MHHFSVTLLAFVGLLALELPSVATARPAPPDDPNAVVATIGGQPVTRRQLEDRVRGKLIELDTERYQVLREGLDEIIGEILLEQAARAQDLSTDALTKREVTDKVSALEVTEPIGAKEIDQFYEQYKDSLGDRSLEELRPSIETYLRAQRLEVARETFEERLRSQGSITMNLPPPTIDVRADGPARGAADAPVTIIAFSDFECPFCQRAASTIDQIVAQHPDAVRLVFRNYPLPGHASARRAAEAAICAHEVGKFWPTTTCCSRISTHSRNPTSSGTRTTADWTRRRSAHAWRAVAARRSWPGTWPTETPQG